MNTENNSVGNLDRTVIAIVGPTCSGKTSLSVDLALKLDGEVVACDSRTIYRQMDIGTAKPTAEEMKGVPHHLMDVVEPDQFFSVAQYKEKGREAIEAIFEKKKVPVICGGTGLYARVLLEGFSIPEVPPNQELRERLNASADKHGNHYLHNLLKEKDWQAWQKIQPNDRFRIIRALEVMEALEIPFSKVVKVEIVPFEVIWIGLTFDDRSILKERISKRLEIQMQQGFIDEVKMLHNKYGNERTLTNAVGYKQLINHIENKISIEEALEETIKHNYQLARKQLIWFRANTSINWLKVDSDCVLLDESLKIIHKYSKKKSKSQQ